MSAALSRKERQKDGIPFKLTTRDLDILRGLNRYRLLKPSQLKRLLFPDTADLQMPRRRLRVLFHSQYVDRIQPLIYPGQGSAEIAYKLGKEGETYLRDNGEEILSFTTDEIRHVFLEHTLAISEFRLNLELALKNHPRAGLERFTADFELKRQLRQEADHPLRGNGVVIFPDAVIILHGKGEHEKVHVLYFLEVDRGTEMLKVLQEKASLYDQYAQKNLCRNFGAIGRFKVLLQTNSVTRAENIRKSLAGLPGDGLVWVTCEAKVDEKTILDEPIWQDEKGCLRGLIRAKTTNPV